MKKTDVLFTLGLPKISDDIYRTLITKGDLSISEIALQIQKYRPAVYEAVGAMLEKQVVARIKKGKRYLYRAVPPEFIQSLMTQRMQETQSLIGTYAEIFQRTNKKAKILFFDGKDGIEKLFELFLASIPKGGVMYRYESPKDWKQIRSHYPQMYFKRASRFGDIDKYVITNEKTQLARSVAANRLSKAVPKSLGAFDYNVSELISGDKVAFIDYDNKTGIFIEDKRFAEFQKKLFQVLFEKL